LTYPINRIIDPITMEKDTLLIKRIDAFLQTSGMSPTTFGKLSLRDPNLVFDVKEGRWLRGPTRKRVLDFIETADVDHGPLQSVGT
jgi:hypothetical protein